MKNDDVILWIDDLGFLYESYLGEIQQKIMYPKNKELWPPTFTLDLLLTVASQNIIQFSFLLFTTGFLLAVRPHLHLEPQWN